MAWKKTPDVAQFKGADWNNFIQKTPNCTPEKAKHIAMCNPNIGFFFFCREYMVLEGPVYEKYGAFQPGDAVFFSGEPWYGSAPQCDGYVKEGMNIAYVSPGSNFNLKDAAKFTMADGSPAIDVVCIFAANYCTLDELPYFRANNNTPPTNKPFNPGIQAALDDGSVAYLQSKGIVVMMTAMNGHTQVGWSEFTSQEQATQFTTYLNNDVIKPYGLDGTDVDDEYSAGTPNDASLIMVTHTMQQAMPGKLITKALFADVNLFPPNSWNNITLVQTLDYGWEMSYGGQPQWRLQPYADAGMAKQNLSLGFWSGQPSANPTGDVAWLKKNGYGGIMIFAFETPANQQLMGTLVNAWYGPGNWNT